MHILVLNCIYSTPLFNHLDKCHIEHFGFVMGELHVQNTFCLWWLCIKCALYKPFNLCVFVRACSHSVAFSPSLVGQKKKGIQKVAVLCPKCSADASVPFSEKWLTTDRFSEGWQRATTHVNYLLAVRFGCWIHFS